MNAASETFEQARLRGCAGRLHLLRMASACLNEGAHETPGVARAACEADPFSPAAAGLLARIDAASRTGLAFAANPAAGAAGLSSRVRKAQGRDGAKGAMALLEAELAARPGDPEAFGAAYDLAWRVGHPAWALGLLARRGQALPLALQGRFAGDMALLAGDPERARREYGEALAGEPGLFSPGLCLALGEALLRLGRPERCLRLWAASLTRHPWHTTLLLRLHDLATGAREAASPLPGPTVCLLYTWNKAALLQAALESVAASALGPDDAVIVLDNGSTDETPRVLAAWAERLGRDARPHFSTFRLPVNVGAPAARNWLLALPELSSFTFAAFLDDDIDLRPDWLLRLGAAVDAYPKARVWGCKVAQAGNGAVLQSADLTLAPGSDETPFTVSDIHLQGPDLGQHDYCRPCASVTGCCHLFRTADLARDGGFDIRFSPSQFDDLARDLRLLLGGGAAVFQGHLTVPHARATGGCDGVRGAAAANARGNEIKLHGLFGPDEVARMRAQQYDFLAGDLARKRERLRDVLDDAAGLEPFAVDW